MANPVLEKNLLVLGCSATKFDCGGLLPAIHRYDGPSFRVLRSFLRGHRWPDTLSIDSLLDQKRWAQPDGFRILQWVGDRASSQQSAFWHPPIWKWFLLLIPVLLGTITIRWQPSFAPP